MPIILSSVKAPLEMQEPSLLEKARRELGVPAAQIKHAAISKVSLDARRRDHICFVYSIRFELDGDEDEAARNAAVRLGTNRVRLIHPEPLLFEYGSTPLSGPVIIAGFGPAGMFAALTLAEQGYCPVVIERGPIMEQRVDAVEQFWNGGPLCTDANVQFGEGGAGTFSDGKLTTRISDSRCGYVLDKFVSFGAPPEILIKAKPHIGTDRLRDVVKRLRNRIIELGGTVLFDTKLESIQLRGGRIYGITTNHGELSAGCLILAIGHSARDTFTMLAESGVMMEAKPFSVGARIEHLQKDIDRGLYGHLAGHPQLPKGEYQLSYRKGGRGVYTFCMCPGGIVVPASSETGGIVTNGMSVFARDGKNANSALVVSVGPADFGSHPLDGMRFQQALEQRAFAINEHYLAPAQNVGNFLEGKAGLVPGRVIPTYARGVTGADLNRLYPPFVIDMMREGLFQFDKNLPGFADGDAVLTGPETRTSSPVRILRNDDGEALSQKGLYPCGEGAGYAGGIMSAAVDGIRTAQHIIRQYAPPQKERP